MELKKELLEFVEANNWFSLEGRKNAEGVIDSYLKSYNKQLTLTDVVSCVCKIPEPRLKVSENGTHAYCNNCAKTYWQK